MLICFFRYQIQDDFNPFSQLEVPINLIFLDLQGRLAVNLAMIRSRVRLSHRIGPWRQGESFPEDDPICRLFSACHLWRKKYGHRLGWMLQLGRGLLWPLQANIRGDGRCEKISSQWSNTWISGLGGFPLFHVEICRLSDRADDYKRGNELVSSHERRRSCRSIINEWA